MRRVRGWIWAIVGAACLWPVTLEAAPCAPSATALCLSAQRFSVQVHWKDFQGNTGEGRAVPLTADTGYFWFFNDANVELVVKVLDARGLNQKFWVFFGALSNVEYDLRVIDSLTGASKTYHNPAGQFASVGDTAAFDSASKLATRSVMMTKGNDAPPDSIAAIQRFIESASAGSAFTPCAEGRFGMHLGGCRFLLSVEWNDGRGGTGVGQPVQLTNDTGYFWFFSQNNIELVVKVLDARAFNGRFWVFFGALSNVEYVLTVTDTLTGNVQRYENPSGRFASVGDTDAFRGGLAVAPVREEARAVTAEIGPEGGTLGATGAGGSRFTLDIPADAVSEPTAITMTPVSRIDRIPFSGGLIAGVELEPQGLRLLVPATLTIQPASPAAAERTLTYAYLGRGEDFILYPRTRGASSLALPVFHFSGYGAGEGSPAEAAQQASQETAGPLAPYVQEIALDSSGDQFEAIVRRAFEERIKPALRAAKQYCELPVINPAIIDAVELARIVANRGGNNPALDRRYSEILQLCIEVLEHCQQKAFDRCLARNDPYEAALIVSIARQLAELGAPDIHFELLESCLRFELDFESKLVEEISAGGYGATKRLKFRAQHVPLRFEFRNSFTPGRPARSGECTLLPVVATYEFNAKPCTVACTPGNDKTRVLAMAWSNEGFDPSQIRIVMFLEPGSPYVSTVETCPVGGSAPPPADTPELRGSLLFSPPGRADSGRRRVSSQELGASAALRGPEPERRVLREKDLRAVEGFRHLRHHTDSVGGDAPFPEAHSPGADAELPVM